MKLLVRLVKTQREQDEKVNILIASQERADESLRELSKKMQAYFDSSAMTAAKTAINPASVVSTK